MAVEDIIWFSWNYQCVWVSFVQGKWSKVSLGTRPFAGGGRVWALSYIRVVPRTECWPGQSESLIANDVMEMVFLQAFSVASD